MKKIPFAFIAFLFAACAPSQRVNEQIETQPMMKNENPTIIESPGMTFEMVKTQYDTLIPIFDGLFITQSEQDTGAYRNLVKTLRTDDKLKSSHGEVILSGEFRVDCTPAHRKWGVIDSTGKIVVPFICDGIAKISDHEGVFSIGRQAHHLDTGIPRYYYQGQCYHFDKTGHLPIAPVVFEYNICFGGDFHEEDHVIRQGTAFFLPIKYVKHSKTSSGSHEGF